MFQTTIWFTGMRLLEKYFRNLVLVYTGEGIVRLSPSSVKCRGASFFRTSSTGKLALLNNGVELFEVELDIEGNFTGKIWE